MGDKVEFTPRARWKHLREEGRNQLADLDSDKLISDKPAWLDEGRFARAKAAIKKFYIGVSYSSLTGLMLILQLPDALESLLATGNSKDIPSLYRRYLSTILHVDSWYDDDVFDPATKGYKSIRQVRSKHKRIQQLMNERFQVKDALGQERKWVNQYDVAITQFSFIGLAMLYPARTAMIAASHEELELINYYWRVLGYLMGLRAEFNACQFDKYEDIKEFMRLILENEFKANYERHECKKGLDMGQSICLALEYFIPLVTFNSLAHWWKDCFAFNGYQLKPLTFKERLLIGWTNVAFYNLLKSRTILHLSTKFHRRRFNQCLRRRDHVHKSLDRRYKDCPHLTYYSDRFDYFGQNNSSSPTLPTSEADCQATGECRTSSKLAIEPAVFLGALKGCPLGYAIAASQEASE